MTDLPAEDDVMAEDLARSGFIDAPHPHTVGAIEVDDCFKDITPKVDLLAKLSALDLSPETVKYLGANYGVVDGPIAEVVDLLLRIVR